MCGDIFEQGGSFWRSSTSLFWRPANICFRRGAFSTEQFSDIGIEFTFEYVQN